MAGDDRAGLRALAGTREVEAPQVGDLTPAEGRKFGLTVGAALLLLGGVILWRGHDTVAHIVLASGGLLVLAGLVLSRRMGPVYRAWMGMARGISRVTTPVVLGLIYFIVITPVGVIRRLAGGSPVKREAEEASYWISRTDTPRSQIERQF